MANFYFTPNDQVTKSVNVDIFKLFNKNKKKPKQNKKTVTLPQITVKSQKMKPNVIYDVSNKNNPKAVGKVNPSSQQDLMADFMKYIQAQASIPVPKIEPLNIQPIVDTINKLSAFTPYGNLGGALGSLLKFSSQYKTKQLQSNVRKTNSLLTTQRMATLGRTTKTTLNPLDYLIKVGDTLSKLRNQSTGDYDPLSRALIQTLYSQLGIPLPDSFAPLTQTDLDKWLGVAK